MAIKSSIEEIRPILDNMIQSIHNGFEKQLLAVILYGSYARNVATQGSDVDLLVVVKTLARDWDSIHRLEDELMLKGRRFGKRFQITLATPEDVLDSVEYAAPLMLEIHKDYRIIFDKDDFFKDCMLQMDHLINERGIRMRKPGVWEVPEHVTSP